MSDELREKLHGYADTIAGVADLCKDIRGGLEFVKELLADILPGVDGSPVGDLPETKPSSDHLDVKSSTTKDCTPSSPSPTAVSDSDSASICGGEPKSESSGPRKA